jgi:murein DD-endopeptidase MepM/ murein hydrolase activator NlpD
VYSIGHGQVTYAQPLGWGVDQGVVIVRHIDESGRTFYSFHGHLDPPSVQLRGNDCVARGDVIGKIGRPRGSPHLHFEIRTHMPGEPGPGYWGTDPRSAGWLAPSATIWDQRHRLLPGYVWSRSFAAEGTLRAGSVDAATQILLEQSSLIGLSDEDGTEHWRVRLVRDDDAPEVTTAVNDAALPQVYVADRFGRIAAYHIPADADETNGQASGQVWELQMENVRGTPTLIALPEGGVAFVADERIIGFSPRGAILWRHQFLATPLDFLPWDGEVIITTSGSGGRIWSLSAARALRWNLSLSGQLVQAGNGAFLYGDGGVYRLDADTQQASLLYRLPNGVFSQGDMVSLPNGGLLLSHLGAGGRRLMALGADGSLQWERSYAGLLAGFPRFAVSGGEVYLIVQEVGGSWSRVAVYALMVDEPSLTLLMVGGTRSPIPGDTWATAPREDRLLVNIGGGDLVALDPKAAAKEVCAAGPALACPQWTARGSASPPGLLPQ